MRLLLAICWKSSRLMRCLLIRQGNDAGGGDGVYDNNNYDYEAMVVMVIMMVMQYCFFWCWCC